MHSARGVRPGGGRRPRIPQRLDDSRDTALGDTSYLVEFCSGLVYLIVAARLLWPASAERRAPLRLLGASFSCIGVSYICTELPYAFEQGALTLPTLIAGRLLYDLGSLLLASFARAVFQRHEAWATGLVVAIAALLGTGAVISLYQGDFDGSAPLGSTGFWIEWSGQLLPFVWVAVGAWVRFSKARKQERLGVPGANTSLRYLLIGLFGLIQLCAFFVAIPVYIIYETQGAFHPWMDALMGALEILPCAIVWIAFFPPAALRARIRGGGAERALRESGSSSAG